VDRESIEIYRQWLVEMLRPHRVILITARPDSWKEQTLARIAELTGWQPMDAYFDDGVTRTPPVIKRHILIDRIFQSMDAATTTPSRATRRRVMCMPAWESRRSG
jgi:hypothetical protein